MEFPPAQMDFPGWEMYLGWPENVFPAPGNGGPGARAEGIDFWWGKSISGGDTAHIPI